MFFWFKHQLYDFLRLIGMRDRLRCPKCRAVGTYKPHGGWMDRPRGPRRRWVCKWCGFYRDSHGTDSAFISPTRKVWTLARDVGWAEGFFTPRDLIAHKANPWKG